MGQRPAAPATSAVADDWQTVSTPQSGADDWETVPGAVPANLTPTGTNKAGFQTFHGTPPKAPTFFSRFGQAVGVPTSMDELKAMFSTDPRTLLENAAAGPAAPIARQVVNAGANAIQETKQGQSPLNTVPKFLLTGPLAPVGGQAVENFAEDVGKKMQPGQIVPRPGAFLQGPAMGDALGTFANLVALGRSHPTSEYQLNKLTAAAGAKGAKAIENTADLLTQTQKDMGKPVTSVQDFKGVVNAAKDKINSEYGNAIGPYANTKPSTLPISQRVLDLITPDMQFTSEGRKEINAIRTAALEYQKPGWTLGALDSKRSRLAADLAAHNEKESVGRYTAERGNTNLAIDNAILDALRDTVYPEADRLAGKPSGYFEDLKSKQSNLMRLEKVLNNRVDDLTGKSREAKGAPLMDKLHGGAYASQGGVHTYIGGLMNVLRGKDVLKSANEAASSGFKTSRPVSQAIVMSYPVRALAADSEQPTKWWEPVPMQ